MSNDFISGIIGGMFGTILGHPIDTLRVNYQINNKLPFIQTSKLFIHHYGLKGLFNGITFPMIGIGLEKMIVFGTFYNLDKLQLTNNNLINGSIAGLSASIIVTPLEKIKILLQQGNKIKNININPKSLYKGFIATTLRESPGYAIYFATYETIKSKDDSPFITFLKGCFTGSFCWLFIYPSDIIKTNVQNGLTYKESIFKIYKNGFFGFFKGVELALLRAGILHGGVFMSFELSKKIF